jgi:adenosine deaminase
MSWKPCARVQIVENEPSLVAFLKKLDWGVAVLADYDACRRVAYENVEDLLRAGIDYAELRFSPAYMAMTHKLHPQGVVEAIIDGVAAGSRDFGIKTNLIGIMSRTFGTEQCKQELDACLAHRDRLVAIDLAGDELGFPGELFTDHFRRVQDAGMRVTVHAGEAAGPESMWQAIRELGAERIGHGVKGHPGSGPDGLSGRTPHRHRVLPHLQPPDHHGGESGRSPDPPVPGRRRAGLPQYRRSGGGGIDLPHEYEVAAPAAGMTVSEIRTAQQNGLTLAFLSEAEKAELSARAAQR